MSKKRRRPRPRPWVTLQRAALIPKTDAELFEVATGMGVSFDQIRHVYAERLRDPSLEIWLNDRYQVAKTVEDDMVHLSIHRLDRTPCRDWRDFQRIKNQLVGAECEGVELYPAESRLVDTCNEFHLWVIADPRQRIPIGFDGGRLTSDVTSLAGSRQRPHNAA